MAYTLHYLLMADHTMLQKQLFASIKDLGLTSGQPKVLDFLKNNDGAIQKDIAQGCHIEPASLSVILNGMEKKGLITRTISDHNRRNLNIFMTDKGKAICGQIEKAFDNIEKKALFGFSREEILQVNAYLTKIYKNLEAEPCV